MEAEKYDLFICYAEEDKWWVEGYLADALQAAGVRYLSESAFRLGVPRIDEFEKAITKSNRILLVVSPAFVTDDTVQFVRRLAQQYGRDSQTWPVIPLYLKAVENIDPGLKMLTSLNATDETEWPQVIERLCLELKHTLPQTVEKPSCPYPGMRPFRMNETSTFFGRQKEVEQLIEKYLRLHPFVAIIGGSGTGKSSLVFAGIVPAIQKSSFFGAGKWLIKSMRPGVKPLETLVKTIPADYIEGMGDDGIPSLAASGNNGGINLLLIVDQFEETFSLAAKTGGNETEKFQQLLMELTKLPACYVVLTVRADFYNELMESPAIWPSIKKHRFELTRLTGDALTEAIAGPARAVRVQIEPALVQRLLADAGNEPGILPFLQETMVLLWNRLERRCITLKAYNSIVSAAYNQNDPLAWHFKNGLEVAMASRADQAMKNLDSEKAQTIARRIFLRLVQFGEGRYDTRRQQKLSQLRAAEDDDEEFTATLNSLVEARLLTATGAENKNEEDKLIDIAHEALLSGWPMLANWIALRKDAEQMRRWLAEMAKKWQDRIQEGNEGGLLDEIEVKEAERWVNQYGGVVGLDESVEKFIKKSESYNAARRKQEEERRQNELERQKELTEAQKLRAEQQEKLTEEQRLRAEDAERFAIEQKDFSDQLKRMAANNSFVQSIGLLGNDKSDRAMARLCQALRMDATHGPALSSLYSLLTRTWHPVPLNKGDVQDYLHEIMYSGDGNYLIGRSTKKVYIWQKEESKPVILEHELDITSMQVNSTSGRLLTSSTSYGEAFGQNAHVAQGIVKLWDMKKGTLLHSCRIHGMTLNAVFGPGEESVLAASAFGPAELTADLQTGSTKLIDTINGDAYKMDNTFSKIIYNRDANKIIWLGTPHLMGNGEMYIWDAENLTLRETLEQPGFSDVTFSPDGSILGFAGPMMPDGMKGFNYDRQGFAGIFSDKGKTEIAFYIEHKNLVTCLAINHLNSRAVSASLDRFAKIWDPQNGDIIGNLEHDSGVTAAAFSPDGRLLVTGTQSGAIRLWNSFTGKSLSENAWQDGEVTSIAFHPTEAWFTVSYLPGYWINYSAATNTAEKMVLETGKPRMKDARFLLQDENRIAIRSEDRIEIWDTLKGSKVSEMLTGNTTAQIAAINENNRTLAITDDKTLSVFDIDTGNKTFADIIYKDKIISAQYTENGRKLLVTAGKTVKVYNAGNGMNELVFITNNEENFVAAHCVQDKVLTAGDEKIVIWNEDAVMVASALHNVEYESREFDGDTRTIVTKQRRHSIADVFVEEEHNRLLVLFGHRGAYVGQPRYKNEFVIEDAQIWSISPLQPVADSMSTIMQARSDYPLNNAFFVKGSDKIISSSNNGDVNIWSAATGGLLFGPLEHSFPINSIALSSDNQVFAAYGTKSTEVNLWNLKTGEPWGRPLVQDDVIHSVKFAGAANVVVTWTQRGTIRFWDAATGLQLPGDIIVNAGIRSVDGSASGDFIITVSNPGVACIHRIGCKKWIEENALPQVISFSEQLCGWEISEFGIEVKTKDAKIAAADENQSKSWTEFLEWFYSTGKNKNVHPGAGLPVRAMIDGILNFRANAAAYYVLQYEPANADALMQVAEAVAYGGRQQFEFVGKIINAAREEEIWSLADHWSHLAALLKGDDSFNSRRDEIVKILNQKNNP